jgi:hypothetical protein
MDQAKEKTVSHVDNILSVYALATQDEIEKGLRWYQDAQDIAQAIADKCQFPLRISVGVIAALSPTNDWDKNCKDADALAHAFVTGGYKEDVRCSTYNPMKDKAWSIMESMPGDDVLVAKILNGPKISDFFWCIMGHDNCVIDGHAWCIAHADRRSMQEVPSIGKKARAELQDAYRVAAHAKGLTAYQMQAITWVAWRRIHGIA